MSRIAFNRNKLRLRRVFGIRARLALLALILVGPLMADRIRVLEELRETQVTRASDDLTRLAESSANAQSELIGSIESVLRASAYVYSASAGTVGSCTIMRASLRSSMPWIRSLSILNRDGSVICSTADDILTKNLSNRPYFIEALKTHGLVVSDYLRSVRDNMPIIMAVFPVSSIKADGEALVIASVNLGWMSSMLNNLGHRPGMSALLIDRAGIVIAAPSDQAGQVGQPLDPGTLRAALSVAPRVPGQPFTPATFTAKDGSQRAVWASKVAGTAGRLVLSIDEATLAGGADKHIRTAYLQLGLVCVFVLLGALFASEQLIIRPVTVLAEIARRLGRGDWSARAGRDGLPAEFVPLARAFNEMAMQLGQRERDMVEANDKLTVMASIDVLTGLANRRGFQSRLDFEWMKAIQTGDDLALLMMDVDHFKAFNDNYGHPEGDACLARFGETLGAIAHDVMGVAGRYGGEEFCLLLPRSDAARAFEIGERVRAAIQALAIPHASTATQRVTASIGLASATPNEDQTPRDLVEAADAALYAAKHRGRNTVVCHGFTGGDKSPLAMAG
ncbi:MAG: diguanylate cyclase [Tardiphaga sp.]|nr:diguanylate cyclase [Tardiphaga sp.]